ncbi:MAG: tryptophan 2,3-dioxygenase family protein [Microscillaceae bacterium]|nr:tryptophan 2,3-dioxygenase family protein [Microscillaceae bacterium]MDW8461852.1 tryptophan 2,3-dioxygenase family protein [Cytophagales bacterium]
MNAENLNENILQKLTELEQKYSLTGQNLIDNLEGLLYSHYLKYWDYIRLDTLLSLQSPRTDFPDEMVFIIYHQITELYFKLILWEIEQITQQYTQKKLQKATFEEKIQRIIRYFKHLSASFDLMTEGMEVEQFRKFRMALLPASGFQSVQFRMIEICLTDFIHLVNSSAQSLFNEETGISAMMPFVYWKQGATETTTQKETITSQYFQEKYGAMLLQLAQEYKPKNIWKIYQKQFQAQDDGTMAQLLRKLDYEINIQWRMAHLKSAAKYLQRDNQVIKATGGTNWQKYLPPRFQKRIFFPALWSEAERNAWGEAHFKEVAILEKLA